jgi:hypothetical protein
MAGDDATTIPTPAITIVPQMHELPRTATFALLITAMVTARIVPCLFISCSAPGTSAGSPTS